MSKDVACKAMCNGREKKWNAIVFFRRKACETELTSCNKRVNVNMMM